jgi:FAD/FMN-containing dehydrogenase
MNRRRTGHEFLIGYVRVLTVDQNLDLLRHARIKAALDPLNIVNPGKTVPDPPTAEGPAS